MNKTQLVQFALLALVVAGGLLMAVRRGKLHPPQVGDSVPDFKLPALGQSAIALRDYHRHVVILNFWATWCPPCVEETPSLEKLAVKLRSAGVVVIGVSEDEDGAVLTKFVADHHLSFPIARDPDRAVASRYGTFKFPESYIIDREGRVAEKIIGPIDWQDTRIVSFVGELAAAGIHAGR